MQTALATSRRRAGPRGRPARLLAAGAATLAGAAVVIAFAVTDGDDRGAPARAAPAPVIDARPLVAPAPAAERFHHRLDVEPGATAHESRLK
jgi:hypothetical protein